MKEQRQPTAGAAKYWRHGEGEVVRNCICTPLNIINERLGLFLYRRASENLPFSKAWRSVKGFADRSQGTGGDILDTTSPACSERTMHLCCFQILGMRCQRLTRADITAALLPLHEDNSIRPDDIVSRLVCFRKTSHSIGIVWISIRTCLSIDRCRAILTSFSPRLQADLSSLSWIALASRRISMSRSTQMSEQEPKVSNYSNVFQPPTCSLRQPL